jgi:AcrR family transcriptional regulator
MPRLSDKTREGRRQHILTSAWGCFSRNGFHATSMDDVIEASGMASTTVYRYFRSKEEIIDASTDVALARVRDTFVRILAQDPCPSPAQTLALLVAEIELRASNPDFDMTRLALQTWAEALRDPDLRTNARARYLEILDRITDLAAQWQADGHLGPAVDARSVATTLLSLMHGLIVMHHLGQDVTAATLSDGLAGLGRAIGGPSADGREP